MHFGASQMNPPPPPKFPPPPPHSPLNKLIVIPAVKVMNSPALHRGLFDLHCWHISNTTCHQSSFQPKEAAVNLRPLTLAAPSAKWVPLTLGDWQLSLKEYLEVWRGGGCSGHRYLGCWKKKKAGEGWGVREQEQHHWLVVWLCVKSLNGAPQHSPQSPFTAPRLKYLQTNRHHGHMFVHLLICWWLESSCSWLKSPLRDSLHPRATLPNSLHLLPFVLTQGTFLILSPLKQFAGKLLPVVQTWSILSTEGNLGLLTEFKKGKLWNSIFGQTSRMNLHFGSALIRSQLCERVRQSLPRSFRSPR